MLIQEGATAVWFWTAQIDCSITVTIFQEIWKLSAAFLFSYVSSYIFASSEIIYDIPLKLWIV